MTEVDKIYPQFYSLLKEAFPNLTESEYQYCYLHIFGFDANDEAKLLGINPDSIRMKRTRIKQKLEKQVDEGISLRDYLIKYLVNRNSSYCINFQLVTFLAVYSTVYKYFYNKLIISKICIYYNSLFSPFIIR